MNCWIQKHNLDADDYEIQNASEAITKFDAFDWLSEVKEEKLKEDKEETCPAGMGFISGEGEILHICPDGEGKNLVFFMFQKTRKFLGLFPFISDQKKTGIDISTERSHRLIQLMFSKEYEKIKEML